MNAKELVRRWKDRQDQILAMLPEAIRIEFHELGVAIRRAEFEFSERKRASAETGRQSSALPSTFLPPIQADALSELGDDFGKMLESMGQRVPLENRKQQVVQFLAKNGPSTRSDILKSSGVPNGSLSNVLLDTALFEKGPNNNWQLVKKNESSEIRPDST